MSYSLPKDNLEEEDVVHQEQVYEVPKNIELLTHPETHLYCHIFQGFILE